MKHILKLKYSRRLDDIFTAFSPAVRMLIPVNLVDRVAKLCPDIVVHMPQASYESYLLYVRQGLYIVFSCIPEEHHTVELLKAVIDGYPTALPEEVYTQELADYLANMQPQYINCIPKNFLTKSHIERAINGDSTEFNVPDSLWDDKLIDLAVDKGWVQGRFTDLPEKFITYDRIKRMIKHDPDIISYKLPFKVDKGLLLEAMLYGSRLSLTEESKRLLTTDFLYELAEACRQAGTLTGIQNYRRCKDMTPTDWVEVIKRCPTALRLFVKGDQTEALVDAFICSATPDEIDSMVNCLNLRFIKKEHALLLINVQSPVLRDLIERKLKPKTVATDTPVVAQADTVILDLTDTEFREFFNK